MSNKPKVEVNTRPYNYNMTIINYSCVEKCKTDYVEVFNRCFKKGKKEEIDEKASGEFFTELSQDLIRTWPKILLTCFIAFIFSYIVLVLFRYAIEYVIWIIYLSFVGIFAAAALACWIFMIISKEKEEKISLLVPSVVLTVITFVGIMILWYFRKRIKLIAQLFKEASKALIDVPSILFEPILTFITLILAIATFIFFLIIIQTAGNPTDNKNLDGTTQVTFEENGGVSIARIINFIAFIWFSQFIFGCQHFVIAGMLRSQKILIFFKKSLLKEQSVNGILQEKRVNWILRFGKPSVN